MCMLEKEYYSLFFIYLYGISVENILVSMNDLLSV